MRISGPVYMRIDTPDGNVMPKIQKIR